MKGEISPYLKITITNESMRAGTFLKQCEAAAMKDDGGRKQGRTGNFKKIAENDTRICQVS